MLDPIGDSPSNSTSALDGGNPGQVAAALTVAIKGKLVMTAPCPKCGLAKRLHEKIYLDGTIRHECKSCGYFMVWHPRAALLTTGRRSDWLAEQQRQIARGVYPD